MRSLLTVERFSLEHRLVDDAARAATTADLLAIIAGDDAAALFMKTDRLWPLFANPEAFDLALETRTRLAAFVELERRLLVEPRHVGRRIRGPEDAAQLFAGLALLDHEQFHAAFVSSKHVVVAVEAIARGGITSVEIAPGEVFRSAHRHGAPALLIAHNHPAGDPQPSEADRELTCRLTQAGAHLGIEVLDHIVLGHAGRAFSFCEGGVFRFA